MQFDPLKILLTGLIINAADIAVTVLFAAKPWTRVLETQGIAPSPFTPPYYIAANFIGGAILIQLYPLMASQYGAGPYTALLASLSLWLVTRIYGGGHVVMRQMPVHLFAIMSAGLGLGYILAGQFLARFT
jgi:hypothetical protein